MKNFITRTITGVLFVLVIITCFLRPQAMVLLFALVTGLTVWEFTGLVNERGATQLKYAQFPSDPVVKINRFISTAAGVFLFVSMAGFCMKLAGPEIFIPYLLTVLYLFVSELFTQNSDPVNDWAYTMMSQMYIALPYSCVCMLAFQEDNVSGIPLYNMLLPLSIFFFLWTNDTGAYCTGSLIGKHKLFPRVSPGKSWEGSIGGGVLVLIVAAILSYIDQNALLISFGAIPTGLVLWQWLGLGLVVVIFGTLGDLVESLFKRTIGVKDSGDILPGHGGMLDRFDSSLMAFPAAVVYIYTVTSL